MADVGITRFAALGDLWRGLLCGHRVARTAPQACSRAPPLCVLPPSAVSESRALALSCSACARLVSATAVAVFHFCLPFVTVCLGD